MPNPNEWKNAFCALAREDEDGSGFAGIRPVVSYSRLVPSLDNTSYAAESYYETIRRVWGPCQRHRECASEKMQTDVLSGTRPEPVAFALLALDLDALSAPCSYTLF
jgi:hypothetical protein